jgi:YggT family protein
MTYERRVVEEVDAQPAVVERRVVRDSGPSSSTILRRIVTLIFGILQALIVLRVVLLLLAANQDNSIVAFILSVTDPFVDPFRGMFSLDQVRGRTGSILDVGALVALVGWTLIEALILAIVGIVDRRREVVA